MCGYEEPADDEHRLQREHASVGSLRPSVGLRASVCPIWPPLASGVAVRMCPDSGDQANVCS